MKAILLTGCLAISGILSAWAACEVQRALPLPINSYPEQPQANEHMPLVAVKTEDEASKTLEKIHKFLKK